MAYFVSHKCTTAVVHITSSIVLLLFYYFTIAFIFANVDTKVGVGGTAPTLQVGCPIWGGVPAEKYDRELGISDFPSDGTQFYYTKNRIVVK